MAKPESEALDRWTIGMLPLRNTCRGLQVNTKAVSDPPGGARIATSATPIFKVQQDPLGVRQLAAVLIGA